MSTQTLVESRLKPGLYLYAAMGSNFFANIASYASQHLGSTIRQIPLSPVGWKGLNPVIKWLHDAADWLNNTAQGAADALKYLSAGLWMNTDSFGFLLASNTPIFGKLTLTCKMKLTTWALTCGAGYEMPKWIQAAWDGVELVTGEMSEKVDAALEHVESKLGHALEQCGKVIDDVAPGAREGAKDVISWAKDKGEALREVSPMVADTALQITGHKLTTILPGGGYLSAVQAGGNLLQLFSRRRRRRRKLFR